MASTLYRNSVIFAVFLFLISCRDDKKSDGGPIVLGDSSVIVTETDPVFLTDFFADIKLRQLAADTIQKTEPPPETPAEAAPTPDEGLSVPFKEITVLIPDIHAKAFRSQNPGKVSSVSYQLTSGNLSGNALRITGGSVQKVSQRYLAAVVARTQMGTLILESLNYTSEWTVMNGEGNNYNIRGLDAGQLNFRKATAREIRNAVSKAAKSKRLSRQQIRRWEISVDNVRSVDQSPLQVVLRSVIWKIEGKDAKGKPFQKQVRIDLPV